MKRKQIIILGIGLIFTMMTIPAQASLSEVKKYKEAFADAKPKCVECHVDAMPKKADGQHELNSYGKAVVAVAAQPTADTYKKVGSIESFGKK
ncbi:MAG: hypothetical protein HQL15_00250 [Candidatus Omnitrophica bacterium]|nr:hypothetical protein [Candidatus Omnitrophota bacterium]